MGSVLKKKKHRGRRKIGSHKRKVRSAAGKNKKNKRRSRRSGTKKKKF